MAYGGKLSAEQYNEFIQGFRKAKGNVVEAARLLNIDARTAKRAFEKGWPALGYKPISEVMEDLSVYEEVIAPAPTKLAVQPPTMFHVERSTVEKPLSPDSGATSVDEQPDEDPVDLTTARQNHLSPRDAAAKELAELEVERLEALREELRIIRTIRNNTLGAQVIATQILKDIQERAPRFMKLLDENIEDGHHFAPGHLANLLQMATKTIVDTAKSFTGTQEAMRLLLGQPQKTSEVKHTSAPSNGDEGDEASEGLRMLGSFIATTAKRKRTSAYSGEELGVGGGEPKVIDVKAIAPADGKAVANEPVAPLITAEPLE